MGIIWKSAMPLLTTLAALVIIVHSAEEDFNAEYRHDLRARTADTGSSSYDPTWRTVEAEPAIQQTLKPGNWDHSEEDLPQHRRPVRKRKRRPLPESSEEQPRERYAYPEEPPRPYFDDDRDNERQTTEMPKRRRKKPENRPTRWTDEVVDIERPLRRRGQRRKRPSAWPVLSDFRQVPDTSSEQLEVRPESNEKIALDDVTMNSEDHFVERPLKIESDSIDPRPSHMKLNRKRLTEEISLPINKDLIQDKSLSEFSSEMMVPTLKEANMKQQTVYDKIHEKTSGVLEPNKKAQEASKIDPLTLKDILKRSNGTSLSEILQLHNLSLTDLLHGKQHAVSVFKSSRSFEDHSKHSESTNDTAEVDLKTGTEGKSKKVDSGEAVLINSETTYAIDLTTKAPIEPVTEKLTTIIEQIEGIDKDDELITTEKSGGKKIYKISTRRRFPMGTRRKLRIRPIFNFNTNNNTYKSQLSRDLVSLNSRKYSHHRRNITKSNQWKDVVLSMKNNTFNESKPINQEITTLAVVPEETTTTVNIETTKAFEDFSTTQEIISKLDDINMDVEETTTVTMKVSDEIPTVAPDKPVVVSMPRPTAVSTGLRQQAFNNRLKRKRLKSKKLSTEAPPDDLITNLFGMGNLVSSSEFIARTQEPKTTVDDVEDFTTLYDFMTTISPPVTESDDIHVKTTRIVSSSTLKPTRKIMTSSLRPITKAILSTIKPIIFTSTEETAKIEIEEILNDTRTSAKLSKILRERNMTLSELVEHRERGSSYVHLADIFHNASREPNPPEPFLAKSLIEPISKETYPLRALLDANSHDTNVKGTTLQPTSIGKINIPVVMDFRNNVNENAENMGIMSLFNNYTKSNDKRVLKDSNGSLYKTSVEAVNITNKIKTDDNTRESRLLNESHDDIVSWNEIFSLMGRKGNNKTVNVEHTKEIVTPAKKVTLDEDTDGDGLIVLEDLQHLKDFDSNIANSGERFEENPFDKHESSHHTPGIFDKIPSQTKSVTVATASIAGLAMILFLLTYAAFKWKQQRSSMISKKRNFDDRIPTPVFENRKGHKNNSSMRSISPMLQTSNIYTLNTLDSRNGKDSPDYMWDSLRKPFQ